MVSGVCLNNCEYCEKTFQAAMSVCYQFVCKANELSFVYLLLFCHV